MASCPDYSDPEPSKQSQVADVQNFIKCRKVIQEVLKEGASCVENVITKWHQKTKRTIGPCQKPDSCCKIKGRPCEPTKQKKGSCPTCLDWAESIEDAVNVQGSDRNRDITWSNLNSSKFYQDPLEVAKAYVFKAPKDKLDVVSRFSQFDEGSLLLIMKTFSPFLECNEKQHKATQQDNPKHETRDKYWFGNMDLMFMREKDTLIVPKNTIKAVVAHLKASEEERDSDDDSSSDGSGFKVKFDEAVRAPRHTEHAEEEQTANQEERDSDDDSSSDGSGFEVKFDEAVRTPRHTEHAEEEVYSDAEGDSRKKRHLHTITKVFDKIRCGLAHFPVECDLHLTQDKLDEHFKDIMDLIACLEDLRHFSKQKAGKLRVRLNQIYTKPVTQTMLEEIKDQLPQKLYNQLKHLTQSVDAVKNKMEKVEKDIEKLQQPDSYSGIHFDISNWQTQLKADYRTNRGGIGFLPGMPKEFPMDDFFVDLTFVKEERSPTKVKKKDLVRYTDLFTLEDKRGHKLDHVLARGEAGSGKTTMVNKLAYEWAVQSESVDRDGANKFEMSRFKLVFALEFRKFKQDMDLVEAIQDQLLTHVSRQDIESYIENNVGECLFLFDGYDESSLGQTVLSSKLLYGSHVIVTTRPHKVDKFTQCHSGYVHVQINGFSQESQEKFVNQYFDVSESNDQNENNKTAQSLIEKIKSPHAYVSSLACFPILLCMICCLWQDSKTLPLTVTALYEEAVKFFARHLHYRGTRMLKTELNFSSHRDELLVQLGSTSLHGLLKKDVKLYFKKDEFTRYSLKYCFTSIGGFLCQFCLYYGVSFVLGIFCILLGLLSPFEGYYLLIVGFTLSVIGLIGFYTVTTSFYIYDIFVRLVFFGVCGGGLFQLVGYLFGVNWYIIPLVMMLVTIVYVFLIVKSINRVNFVYLAIQLGLLTQVCYKQLDLYKTHEYSFIHKTFQEFCAAKYWVSLIESDRQKFDAFLKHINKDNVGEFDILLKFCCGLSMKAAHVILEYIQSFSDELTVYTLLNHSLDKCPSSSRRLVMLFYEADSLDESRQNKQELHNTLMTMKTFVIECHYSLDFSAVLYYYLHDIHSLYLQTWLSNMENVAVCLYLLSDKMIKVLQFAFESKIFKRSSESFVCTGFRLINYNGLPKFVIQHPNIYTLKFVLFNLLYYNDFMEATSKHLHEHMANHKANAVTFFHTVIPHIQELTLFRVMDQFRLERLISIIINEGKRVRKASQNVNRSMTRDSHQVGLPMRILNLGGNSWLFHEMEESEKDVLLFRLTKAFKYLPKLEYLSLANNRLNGNNLNTLCQSLGHFKNLKGLNLSSYQINDKIYNLSFPDRTEPTHDGRNKFGQAGDELSQCLQNLPNLTDLDLQDTGLTDNDLSILPIDRLPCLTKLNLADNQFGSSGIIALCASLPHIPNLTRFEISGSQNDVDYTDGFVALAEAFCHIPLLTHLNICSRQTSIRIKGAEAIFRNLVYLHELAYLKLPRLDEANARRDVQNIPSYLIRACMIEIPAFKTKTYWLELNKPAVDAIVTIVNRFDQ